MMGNGKPLPPLASVGLTARAHDSPQALKFIAVATDDGEPDAAVMRLRSLVVSSMLPPSSPSKQQLPGRAASRSRLAASTHFSQVEDHPWVERRHASPAPNPPPGAAESWSAWARDLASSFSEWEFATWAIGLTAAAAGMAVAYVYQRRRSR